MPDTALQVYEYAERYAQKIQDSIGIFTIWGNKSNALITKGEIKKALRIKEAAAEGFRVMGYDQKAARDIGGCIKWYAQQGEFDKAKAAMDDYENHSGYFMENGDTKPGKEGYYSIKGTYFLEKGELDSAEHYFRKLQHSGTTRNDLYLATWGLTQLYYHKDQLDSIGKYALQTFLHSDTLYNIGAAENLQYAQAQYDYTRHLETAHRKELEAKDMEISRRNWIIAGVLLLSIIVFFWRKQIRLKKSELRTANRKNTQLSTQLHTANEENAQLNTQIDANNQEINTLNTQLDTANEENIQLHT
jgi:cell division protein FtsB